MEFGSRQRGMGVTGWLLLILIFGSALTIGLKLIPAYMDHRTIANVLDSLTTQSGLGDQRLDRIQGTIERRLKVNNIREFDFENNMSIARDNDGVIVTVDYEVRVDLMGNVDLVADFYKQVRFQ